MDNNFTFGEVVSVTSSRGGSGKSSWSSDDLDYFESLLAMDDYRWHVTLLFYFKLLRGGTPPSWFHEGKLLSLFKTFEHYQRSRWLSEKGVSLSSETTRAGITRITRKIADHIDNELPEKLWSDNLTRAIDIFEPLAKVWEDSSRLRSNLVILAETVSALANRVDPSIKDTLYYGERYAGSVESNVLKFFEKRAGIPYVSFLLSLCSLDLHSDEIHNNFLWIEEAMHSLKECLPQEQSRGEGVIENLVELCDEIRVEFMMIREN